MSLYGKRSAQCYTFERRKFERTAHSAHSAVQPGNGEELIQLSEPAQTMIELLAKEIASEIYTGEFWDQGSLPQGRSKSKK